MFIKVKIKPHAGEQSVERISPRLFNEEGFEALYFVKLKAAPIGGGANIELLKLLKKYFGKNARIRSGFTSRNKIVEIIG